jgi:hypothetical protein
MDRMSINRPIKMKAGVRIIEIGIGIAIEIEKNYNTSMFDPEK